MRLIAALGVVFYHMGSYSRTSVEWTLRPTDPLFPFLGAWTEYGWVGVQFFFVLSGFVIANSASRSTVSQFAVNRMTRIAPALWICSTLTFVLVVALTGTLTPYIGPYLRALVLWPKGPHIDGVVWTLVVEAIFYGVVALTIWGARTHGGFNAVRDWLAAGLIMWTGCYVVLHGTSLLFTDQAETSYRGFVYSVLLLRHGAFFGLGMLIWAITQEGWTRRRAALVALAALICVAQVMIWAALVVTAWIAAAVWIASMLLLLGAIGARHWSVWDRMRAPLLVAGRVSYPLYLGHQTIGAYLGVALGAAAINAQLLFALFLLGFVGLAYGVAQGPERALQRVLRAQSGKRIAR